MIHDLGNPISINLNIQTVDNVAKIPGVFIGRKRTKVTLKVSIPHYIFQIVHRFVGDGLHPRWCPKFSIFVCKNP